MTTQNKNEQQNADYWNDDTFIAEIERRTSDYKNGLVKAITWEDAKTLILNQSRTEKNNKPNLWTTTTQR